MQNGLSIFSVLTMLCSMEVLSQPILETLSITLLELEGEKCSNTILNPLELLLSMMLLLCEPPWHIIIVETQPPAAAVEKSLPLSLNLRNVFIQIEVILMFTPVNS